jgi:hypothetical protein
MIVSFENPGDENLVDNLEKMSVYRCRDVDIPCLGQIARRYQGPLHSPSPH